MQTVPDGLEWPQVEALLQHFWQQVRQQLAPRHHAGRVKQWLNLLRRRHAEAEILYQAVRTLADTRLITLRLAESAAGRAPTAAPLH
jgi:tRNA-dihydrouridine synthase C